MTSTTRRAALGALAGVSALALPAVAIAASPTGDDAELISLAAEIQRLRAQVKEISAKGIEPFNETFYRLVQDTPGPWRVGFEEACAYSHKVGREAAIEEQQIVDDQGGLLWEQMLATPAATRAGKAAKVRALITLVHTDEWRGPTSDLDWAIRETRSLLGDLAGMSEEELAAI
jgi:hypothetical protein